MRHGTSASHAAVLALLTASAVPLTECILCCSPLTGSCWAHCATTCRLTTPTLHTPAVRPHTSSLLPLPQTPPPHTHTLPACPLHPRSPVVPFASNAFTLSVYTHRPM